MQLSNFGRPETTSDGKGAKNEKSGKATLFGSSAPVAAIAVKPTMFDLAAGGVAFQSVQQKKKIEKIARVFFNSFYLNKSSWLRALASKVDGSEDYLDDN